MYQKEYEHQVWKLPQEWLSYFWKHFIAEFWHSKWLMTTLARSVWSHLNMPKYNIWSNCIEKQISGLIRHCTQILVIFVMFDTHCQHFISKYRSKPPKTDIQNNRCISISLDKFVMRPDCYLTLHDCIVTYSSSFYNDSKNS